MYIHKSTLKRGLLELLILEETSQFWTRIGNDNYTLPFSTFALIVAGMCVAYFAYCSYIPFFFL